MPATPRPRRGPRPRLRPPPRPPPPLHARPPRPPRRVGPPHHARLVGPRPRGPRPALTTWPGAARSRRRRRRWLNDGGLLQAQQLLPEAGRCRAAARHAAAAVDRVRRRRGRGQAGGHRGAPAGRARVGGRPAQGLVLMAEAVALHGPWIPHVDCVPGKALRRFRLLLPCMAPGDSGQQSKVCFRAVAGSWQP